MWRECLYRERAVSKWLFPMGKALGKPLWIANGGCESTQASGVGVPWGALLGQAGFVLLAAGLSPCTPHSVLVQNNWKIPHFHFNPRQGLLALACGCPVAVALALTWWPEEQKVSS